MKINRRTAVLGSLAAGLIAVTPRIKADSHRLFVVRSRNQPLDGLFCMAPANEETYRMAHPCMAQSFDESEVCPDTLEDRMKQGFWFRWTSWDIFPDHRTLSVHSRMFEDSNLTEHFLFERMGFSSMISKLAPSTYGHPHCTYFDTRDLNLKFNVWFNGKRESVSLTCIFYTKKFGTIQMQFSAESDLIVLDEVVRSAGELPVADRRS